jgi:hypothetical protein
LGVCGCDENDLKVVSGDEFGNEFLWMNSRWGLYKIIFAVLWAPKKEFPCFGDGVVAID